MTEQESRTTLNGEFESAVAIKGSEAVDARGSQGMVYKPSGPVNQIIFKIQGFEAGQAATMKLGEVRRLIEEVRAYLPTKSQWLVTESGVNRLTVETQHPVTAPLHFRLQSLIEDYTALFAGRENEIAKIEAFLQRQEGGYVLVTGKSGFGKTALLANLIAKNRPPIGEQKRIEPGPYLYHFLSYLRGTHRREDMLRNLCQQMMAYYQIEGRLPSRLDDLEALYARLVRLPLVQEHRPFVLVIDGIDEADGGFISNLHIPTELPTGKIVVFSARETGVDWLTEFSIPRERTHVLQLERFGAYGVRRLLQEAGGHAQGLAKDQEFIRQVLDMSEGEPFYLRYLVEDIRDGVIGLDNIGRQPQGLSRYLDGWWRELSAQVLEEEARQLLGLLLVARAPLPRSDILGIYPELAWGMDGILQTSRRFIVGNDDCGYTLCHPRFQEHLSDKLKTVVTTHQQALLNYCARWQEHKSPYVLRHYTAHLIEVNDEDTLKELLTREWAEARHQLESDYAGFLRDVDKVWKIADEQHSIGLQIRCALLKSTIFTLAMNIMPELVCLAVENDLWSPQTGFNYIRQVADEEQQSQGLIMLAPYFPSSLLQSALNAAQGIESTRYRSETLIALAPHLPPGLQDQALDAARGIENAHHRSEALTALAPHLSPKLQERALNEALDAARSIGYADYRIKALASLAPHLSLWLQDQILSEALDAARGIENAHNRSEALTALAPHLSPKLQEQALNEALDATQSIGYAPGRIKALTALAPHLPPGLQEQALDIARGIGSDQGRIRAFTEDITQYRSEALTALVPHLPPILKEKVSSEALDIARNVEFVITRVAVLTTLVPHLPPGLQEQALSETLDTARGIENAHYRSAALTALVPHLPSKLREQVLGEALKVAQSRAINDKDIQQKVEVVLKSYLPSSSSQTVQLPCYLDWEAIQEELSVLAEYFGLRPTKSIRYGFKNLGRNLIQLQRVRDTRDTTTGHYVKSTLSSLKRLMEEMESYDGWVFNLHNRLSNSVRRDLLWMIGVLTPRIVELGTEKSIVEVLQAIQDVTEWWP